MLGVLFLLFSFDSCIVIMSTLCESESCYISDVFFCIPFILIWMMFILELGLWFCGV